MRSYRNANGLPPLPKNGNYFHRLVQRVSDREHNTAEDATCTSCHGDGWYVGHEEECYTTGDCVCDGVQIQCETCGGLGRLDAVRP